MPGSRGSAPRSRGPRIIGLALLLLFITAVAYQPAWHGGLLWDDDAHLTPETLRSWAGLLRLWTDTDASQQYYPVTSTAFWIMAGLWGDETLGYHLVNVALHAFSATLAVAILRRLGVAAAVVAGTVFALHPVHVESVAWISELKNTLSGTFYLSALLMYLKFDDSRNWREWTTSAGLFALALGSKSVTATLPAAILVVLWFRRGTLEWGRDVRPLVPFLVVGMGAGLLTSWLEYHWVGAHGQEFDLGVPERGLLAGRAALFYVWTIVWPFGLTFNYPRWAVDASVWWQYLFPLGVAAALIFCFRIRSRSRAPLAIGLFTLVTLGPALGFVNVYPFRYSFVANHFQYLASLGTITAGAVMLVMLVRRWRLALPIWAIAALVAVPLGVLTHAESRSYGNAETLYRTTLARNPSSSLARNNLAKLLLDGPAAGWIEAGEHVRAVLSARPSDPVAHNLLGLVYQKAGNFAEAEREHREAARLSPSLAEAHYNLGTALDGQGRVNEAIAAYEASLALYPHDAQALHNLATALRRARRFAEATARAGEAARVSPDNAAIRTGLAHNLLLSGRPDAALVEYREAARLDPSSAEAWNNLGQALVQTGRPAEAFEALRRAVDLAPSVPLVHANLSGVLATLGRLDEAIAAIDRAIALSRGDEVSSLERTRHDLLARRGR